MRVLGAIIAGGQSRRFGSDKALAVIDGRPMIAHVTEALRPQVEMVAICGRDWPGLDVKFDWLRAHFRPKVRAIISV